MYSRVCILCVPSIPLYVFFLIFKTIFAEEPLVIKLHVQIEKAKYHADTDNFV